MKVVRVRRIVLLLGIVSCLTLQGCAVVALVGAAAMIGHVDSKEREAFAKINVEREKLGLPPLTWKEYKKPSKTKTTAKAE